MQLGFQMGLRMEMSFQSVAFCRLSGLHGYGVCFDVDYDGDARNEAILKLNGGRVVVGDVSGETGRRIGGGAFSTHCPLGMYSTPLPSLVL